MPSFLNTITAAGSVDNISEPEAQERTENLYLKQEQLRRADNYYRERMKLDGTPDAPNPFRTPFLDARKRQLERELRFQTNAAAKYRNEFSPAANVEFKRIKEELNEVTRELYERNRSGATAAGERLMQDYFVNNRENFSPATTPDDRSPEKIHDLDVRYGLRPDEREGFLAGLGRGFLSTFNSQMSGINRALGYSDEAGGWEQRIRDNAQWNPPEENSIRGTLGRWIGSAAGSTAPSALPAMVNPFLGMGTFYAADYGNRRKEYAEKFGENKTEAELDAMASIGSVANTAIEQGLGLLPMAGRIGQAIKGSAGKKLADTMIGKMLARSKKLALTPESNIFKRLVTAGVINGMGEATEEGAQYITDYALLKAFGDKDAEFSWDELLENMAAGLVGGGVLGSVEGIRRIQENSGSSAASDAEIAAAAASGARGEAVLPPPPVPDVRPVPGTEADTARDTAPIVTPMPPTDDAMYTQTTEAAPQTDAAYPQTVMPELPEIVFQTAETTPKTGTGTFYGPDAEAGLIAADDLWSGDPEYQPQTQEELEDELRSISLYWMNAPLGELNRRAEALGLEPVSAEDTDSVLFNIKTQTLANQIAASERRAATRYFQTAQALGTAETIAPENVDSMHPQAAEPKSPGIETSPSIPTADTATVTAASTAAPTSTAAPAETAQNVPAGRVAYEVTEAAPVTDSTVETSGIAPVADSASADATFLREIEQRSGLPTGTLKLVRTSRAAFSDPEIRAAAALISSIGRYFGTRTVLFDGPVDISGVTINEKSRRVAVNLRSDEFQNLAAKHVFHEIFHQLAKQYPREFAELSSRLEELASDKEKLAIALARYRANREKFGLSIDEKAAMEEFACDFLADECRTPEFWKRLAEKNLNLARRIIELLTDFLNKFHIAGKQSKQSAAKQVFQKNLEEAREAGRRFIREVEQRRKTASENSSAGAVQNSATTPTAAPAPVNDQQSAATEAATAEAATVKLSSVAEITDKDFISPVRNIELPPLPEKTLSLIGKTVKPVLLKKNILQKNHNNHPELSTEKSREALDAALYNNDIIGQSQPVDRPDYWVAVKLKSGENAVVVLDMAETKTHHEIVGWRIVNDKGIESLKRQAKSKGGHILSTRNFNSRDPSDQTGAFGSETNIASSSEKSSRDTGSNTQNKAEPEAENKDKKAKIENYGEKIGGARKDMFHSVLPYADVEALSDNDLYNSPLDKVFPLPDYAKLEQDGIKREKLALIKAVRDMLPHKPTSRWEYKKNKYVKQVKEAIQVTAYVLADKVGIKNLRDKLDKLTKEYREYLSEKRELRNKLDELSAKSAAEKNTEKANSIKTEYHQLYQQYLNKKFDGDKRSLLESLQAVVPTAEYLTQTTLPLNGWKFDYSFSENIDLDGNKYYKISRSGYNIGDLETRDKQDINKVRAALDSDISKRIEDTRKRRESGKNDLPKGITISYHYNTSEKSSQPTREYQIVSDSGKNAFVLKDGFASKELAENFLNSDAGRQELGNIWAEIKDIYKFKDQETSRTGEDYRNGRDISPQELAETFGFRGIEFGNWSNQADRQKRLNETFDALNDLCKVIGISPRAVSLGGELAMAFGARGFGVFNAHFETDRNVINLTKTRGAGSLAHEWLHALDNYFARRSGHKLSMATNISLSRNFDMRPELLAKWRNLVMVLQRSNLMKRSFKHGNYWSRIWEVAARAFERYVSDKAAAAGFENDFLVNIFPDEERSEISRATTPMPLREDMEKITPAFDEFFQTLQEKVEDGKTVLFSLESDTETARVNEEFNRRLEQQIAGTLPQGYVYQLGSPSEILLGTGIPDLRIELAAVRLDAKSKQKEHPFDIAALENLPEALRRPVAVFAYGDRNKAQNIIVDIRSGEKNFLIGLHLNRIKGTIRVNDIRGLFPKDTWEWMNWIQQGKALYLDKEKVLKLIGQQRINFAEVTRQNLDSIINIVRNFKNASAVKEKNPTGADNSADNPLTSEQEKNINVQTKDINRYRRFLDERSILRLNQGQRSMVETFYNTFPLGKKITNKLGESIELRPRNGNSVDEYIHHFAVKRGRGSDGEIFENFSESHLRLFKEIEKTIADFDERIISGTKRDDGSIEPRIYFVRDIGKNHLVVVSVEPKTMLLTWTHMMPSNNYLAEIRKFERENVEQYGVIDKDGNKRKLTWDEYLEAKRNEPLYLATANGSQPSATQTSPAVSINNIHDKNEKSSAETEKNSSEVKFSLTDDNRPYYQIPFAASVDDALNNKNGHDGLVYIRNTPQVLKAVGIPELPMMITRRHLQDIYSNHAPEGRNAHDMSEQLKSLPKMLEKPVAVIRSATHPDSRVVVITQYKDKSGREIIIPIELSANAVSSDHRWITAHIVTSAYGKSNIWEKNGILTNAVEAENNGETAVFGGNKRVTEKLRSPSVQFLGAEFSVIHNIADAGIFVKPQTETLQFKRWFKNSKVVDAQGKPLVVYHGSPNYGFNVFDKSKQGQRDRGDFGRGFYFTPSKDYAATYALEGYWNLEGDDSKVYACYLSLQNPLIVNARTKTVMEGKYRGRILEQWMVEDGEHDGVIVKRSPYDSGRDDGIWQITEVVATKPEQIKSATDNAGTFDPGNPDINFSLTDDSRTDAPAGVPPQPWENTNDTERKRFENAEAEEKQAVGGFFRRMFRSLEHGMKSENERVDLWTVETLLKPMMYLKEKIPALERVYEAASSFYDNKQQLINHISMYNHETGESVFDHLERFRKSNPKDYAKVSAYLVEADRNQQGFTVQASINEDKFTVFGPEGEFTDAAFDDREKAWHEAFRREEERLKKKNGFSAEAAAAVRNFREMMRRSLLVLASNARQAAAEAGISEDEVFTAWRETGRDGELTDHRVSVAELILQMDEVSGFYFPRIRKSGRHILYAFKAGENPLLERFDTKLARALRAAKLEKSGYKVRLSDAGTDMAARQMITPIDLDAVFAEAENRTASKAEAPEVTAEMESYRRKDGSREPHLVIRGELSRRGAEKLRQLGGKWYRRGWHFVKPGKSLIAAVNAVIAAEEVERRRTILEAQLEIKQVIADVWRENTSRSHRLHRSGRIGKEVFIGYEEDMIRAAGLYTSAISSGTAKTIMAARMFGAVTGTDVSFRQFAAEQRPDLTPGTPEYFDEAPKLMTAYQKAVEKRRIDARLQPVAWKTSRNYMAHMLRNSSGLERCIGWVRFLAAIKYLSRPSSALINSTALVVNVPPAVSAAAGTPLRHSAALAGEGLVKYIRYSTWSRYGVGKAPVVLDKRIFDYIREHRWDEAEQNRAATEAALTFASRGWRKTGDTLLWLFGHTEMANRAATIYAAARALLENTPEALENPNKFAVLMREAKKVSDKAHGDYTKANKLSLAQGGSTDALVADSFLMFKTFQINAANLTWEMAKKGDWRGILWMTLVTSLLGGASTPLLLSLLNAALAAVGIRDKETKENPDDAIYRWLYENGMDRTAGVWKYGLPSLAGVNLRGSLASDMELPETIADLLGAPASVLTDTAYGLEYAAKGNTLKAAEKLLPAAAASPIRAYREHMEGVTNRRNTPTIYKGKQIRPSPLDTVWRTLGFNPVSIAERSERLYSDKRISYLYQNMRGDIYDRIVAWKNRGGADREELARIIEKANEYNARVRRSGRDLPLITLQTLRKVTNRSR